MQKLAFYALALATLQFGACTQSLSAHASQKSVLDKEKFYGEVWIRPGKRLRLRPGGTLYLKEASSQGIAPKAMSSFSLQSMYGSPMNRHSNGNEKVYYITE